MCVRSWSPRPGLIPSPHLAGRQLGEESSGVSLMTLCAGQRGKRGDMGKDEEGSTGGKVRERGSSIWHLLRPGTVLSKHPFNLECEAQAVTSEAVRGGAGPAFWPQR